MKSGRLISLRIFPLGKVLIFSVLTLAACIFYSNVILIGTSFFETGGWPAVIRHFPEEEFLLALATTVLALFSFLGFRHGIARLEIKENSIRYRNAWIGLDAEIPRHRLRCIEVKRLNFSFKTRGSVDEVFLVTEGQVRLSLGSPLFMGFRVLDRAHRLSQELSLPLADPIGETMRDKTFFWDRWKYRGEDYKILIVIFGLALVIVAGIRWYENGREKAAEEFLRNYQKSITDPEEKDVYERFFKLKEELEKKR